MMKDTMEKAHRRYVRVWHFFTFLLGGWIDRKFNYSHDTSELEAISGPVLFIPNHVCEWDPVLVGFACKNRPLYFVMSEHMIREPLVGKIISYLFSPILRRKAATDLEVVRSCLKHIKAGHSICLFAEGDQSWDGVTGTVYPATGQLVKLCGATLVTYRLEGAFMSRPRWASDTKRGMIHGRIAGIYPPDVIEKMSPEEVLHVIENDLYFDMWEWQRSLPEGPVEFKGRRKSKDYAKGIDMLFHTCPGCKSIGTIRTADDEIFCECGFRARLLRTGFIEPVSSPLHFTELPEWDRWQNEELQKRIDRIIESGSEEILFKDGPMKLSLIESSSNDTVISEGDLSLAFKGGEAILSAGERSFVLKEIENMGLILSKLILFTYGKEYYQIRTDDVNIRKYLLVWKMIKTEQGAVAP